MVFSDWDEGEWTDALFPLFLLALLIVGNIFIPDIRIGYPTTLAYNIYGDYVAIGLVAPLGEEFAFRVLFLAVLDELGPIGVVIQAIAFSIFHWSAYGIGMSAAFLGALLFGLLAGWYMYSKKTLWAAIGVVILHSGFNLWLAFVRSLVIGA